LKCVRPTSGIVAPSLENRSCSSRISKRSQAGCNLPSRRGRWRCRTQLTLPSFQNGLKGSWWGDDQRANKKRWAHRFKSILLRCS
jgi:hypothetical protein